MIAKKTSWKIIITIFLMAVVFVFGFQNTKIDYQRMEKTFLMNDRVWISKFHYGIHLPFLNKLILQGNGPIIGDVIAFRYPKIYDKDISQKPLFISRCIGTAGDTIQIIKKEIFVNNLPQETASTVQIRYRMSSTNGNLPNKFYADYAINQGGKVNDAGIYDFPLTKKQADLMSSDDRISGLRVLNEKSINRQKVFPLSAYYSFSIDNFGPVKIPKKGWTVPINVRNIDLYKHVIREYEGNSIKLTHDKVFINGTEAFSYTFKNDYYFVIDDNRDYADDSRYWGFLPANHLVGKVLN